MNTTENIGRRVSYGDQANPRTIGTITALIDESPKVFSLLGPKGSTMAPLGAQYRVTYDDGRQTQMFENAPDCPGGWQWEDSAHIAPSAEVAMLEASGSFYMHDQTVKREKAHDEREAREAAHKIEVAKRRPSWAKACIVAEYHESDTDTMTDYFGHHTTRTLILAWSKHARDLFPEMRKAARNHPELAHLVTAVDAGDPAYYSNEEHREKYSMGGGYYLGVYRHNSGWVVKKNSYSVPIGEWCIPS